MASRSRFSLAPGIILLGLIGIAAGCSPKVSAISTTGEKEIPFSQMLLFDFGAGSSDWAQVNLGARRQGQQDLRCFLGGTVRNGHPFAALISGGDMFVDQLKLSPDPQREGRYGPGGYSAELRPFVGPLFGGVRQFVLSGNATYKVPPFQASLYVPPLLEVEFQWDSPLRGQGNQVRPEGVLNLSWNADPDNPRQMLIWISFPEPEGYQTPSDPQASYREQLLIGKVFRSQMLGDNGQFSLDLKSWLSQVPDQGKVNIGLARGNQRSVKVEGKSFRMYARTSVSRDLLLQLPSN